MHFSPDRLLRLAPVISPTTARSPGLKLPVSGPRRRRKIMRTLLLSLVCSLLFIPTFLTISAESQENTSSSQAGNDSPVEGTVVSSTRSTLVVRSDDNQYHLFTYDRSVRTTGLVQGARVRVTASD